MNPTEPTVTPSTASEPTPFQRIIGLAAIVIVISGLAYVFSSALTVLLLVFAGLLAGILLGGLSKLLAQHTPLAHWQALAAVVLTLVAAAALFAWLALPALASQVTDLVREAPELEKKLEEYVHGSPVLEAIWSHRPSVDQLSANGEMMPRVLGVFSTLTGGLGGILFVLVTGFYFASEPATYQKVVLLLPKHRRQRAREVMAETGAVLWQWLLGRLLGMTIIGTGWAIGLWLLGVKSAVTLGVLAGLLEFVPLIGPALALGPALVIALASSPQAAAGVFVFYLALQAVESYLITPMIERRTVTLPPVLTLSAQVLLGVWAGALGVVVASPLVATVLTLIRRLYLEDTLHDTRAADMAAPEGFSHDGNAKKS